ncbi:MAG: cyanoexosortase A [Snowella sp.]
MKTNLFVNFPIENERGEMDWTKSLQKIEYWLVALSCGLVVLHLTLIDKSQNENLFSTATLIWLTIGSLLWDRRKKLILESDTASTFVGMILVVLTIVRNLTTTDSSLRLFPLIAGVGVILIASGFKSLKSYGKEIILLSLLLFLRLVTIALNAFDLPLLTAKVSAFMLWFVGFDVVRQGVVIALPTGRVEVYGACSGVESIVLMLCIAILFFFLISISHWQKMICIAIAVALGFMVNAFRVALLAFFVDVQQPKAFEYWHSSDGSLSFAILSVFMFGIFCWFVYVRHLDPSSAMEKGK